jgi:hypothetical protein
MKKVNLFKRKLCFGVLAGLFASTVLATGGNGNEPRRTNKEEVKSFCQSYPVVCSIFTLGTGGNGNEPSKR